ncbi:hypothetical protein D3C80_1875550 [compost metagenome]
MFGTGHLHELLDVVGHFRDIRELLCQFGNDRRDVALAVDQAADQRCAVVELDHALGVQQHMAFLGRLVLEAVAGAPVRHLLAIETHRAIPLCQTRSWVTE